LASVATVFVSDQAKGTGVYGSDRCASAVWKRFLLANMSFEPRDGGFEFFDSETMAKPNVSREQQLIRSRHSWRMIAVASIRRSERSGHLGPGTDRSLFIQGLSGPDSQEDASRC
jgi:hypothetical protein